jgi:hypothetical protein
MRIAGRTVRSIAVAGVLTGAAVLGGCAQSPGNAATVGGTAITRSAFDQAVSGAKQVSQLRPDQVLSVLIQGEVAAQVAQQRGITITDADRDKQLNPAVLKIPDAHDLAYDLADVQIVSSKIGQNAFGRELARADVTVNPRYGSWNPQKSLAVVPDSGSLSQVAPNRPR